MEYFFRIIIYLYILNLSQCIYNNNKNQFLPGKVNIIDSDNIGIFLNKQPLLLEFKATWCAQCQFFNSVYEKVASDLPYFRVGAIDIDKNPAVVARFDVIAIPTVFLYKDNKIWKYEGQLSAQDIVDWSTKGYKTQSSIPIWSSPMGPMGVSKGILIALGNNLIRSMPFLTEYFGIPDWVGFIIIASLCGFVILLITLIFIYVGVQHAKID